MYRDVEHIGNIFIGHAFSNANEYVGLSIREVETFILRGIFVGAVDDVYNFIDDLLLGFI